ncbi:hypothetical protein HaLaN_14982 [Haematococcus lacustris]|uniref:Uncharacterized protein n=1 Tax=Haematococcus lacustris TaxID=44745 RepID=A0A699ZHG2_HAELA|nr:hypothetical protein HaLaN_14982 [Haematococcus lacustris]
MSAAGYADAGVVMPLEADPVEAVLIAVDDVDAKTDDLQATLMWQAIIRTAQRQGIRVIAYTVRSDFNTATLAQIKRALASDPDISIEEVSFIEDYQVDSIWMRDYGPLGPCIDAAQQKVSQLCYCRA